jgi:hypothetical protein
LCRRKPRKQEKPAALRSRNNAPCERLDQRARQCSRARARIEDQHCRQGAFECSLGSDIFEMPNDGLISKPRQAWRRDRWRWFWKSIAGTSGTSSPASVRYVSTYSLSILEHRAGSRPASREDPVDRFLPEWSQGR